MDLPRFRGHLTAGASRGPGKEFKCHVPDRRTRRSSDARRSTSCAPQASRSGKIATDLGVSEQTLRNWVKQADVDLGKREGLTTAGARGAQRAEAENRVLREEREMLRKAAAFFARESERR